MTRAAPIPARPDGERGPRAGRLLTYDRLKWASFTHSTIYALLLICWLAPGLEGPTFVFGLAHGIGWIVMSLLVLVAQRLRIVSFQLAVLVCVVGAFGPFAGSAGFVWERRRRLQGAT